MASTSSSSPYSSSDEDSLNLEPPRKRRRTSRNYTESSLIYRQLCLEEIDLEIALRQRLAETVKCRMKWASLLEESLNPGFQTHISEEGDFCNAALDALDAIEAPCDIVYNREIRLAPKPIILSLLPPASSFTSAPETVQTASSRSSRLRIPRAPPPPSKRLLFLRNTNTNPPAIAKLACPDCSRSDFSNLQGLLNHCRIRHHREYGSHDECIQSCAVLVHEEERDWVVANGTELGGISIPSLRRLFEIAVGAGEAISIPGVQIPSAQQDERAKSIVSETPPLAEETEEFQPASAHITRTLGYHQDTPALAPFLGRAPKKRCINVYVDENEVIDIEDSTSGRAATCAWRMPYTHRNIARAELDEVVPVPPAPSHTSEGPQKADIVDDDINPPSQSSGLHLLSGSRFHIAARIQVADYSFWIPAVRRSRSNQDHSHRWRLTVSSPSYSLDITTFLTKLTVTCLTDPSPSTFVEPIIITDPPFVVGGTTDRPFLAKLTFTWAGSMNAPLEIEHWVELDPVHVSHPVLGDEQVFDVELDRNTEFLPTREDSRPVTWEDEQATSNLARSRNKVDSRKDQVVVEPDYVVKLRSLLPRVPMTAKDVKGRLSGRLPYTLVTAPAQLRNLVIGRRKAIEMGRARALRDAYQRLVTSELQESGFTPLTTADVYRWLEDEGLFHRSTGSKHKDAPQKSQDERQEEVLPIHPDREAFCRTCGLHQSYHPAVIKSEYPGDTKIFPAIQPGPRISGTSPCMSFNGESTRLPLLDVERLLSPASNNVSHGLCPAVFAVPPPVISHGYIPSSSDLVSIGDPKLISAIRALAGVWKLEHLGWGAETTLENDHLSSRTELDRPKAVVDDQLAPFAVLATLTKLFVRLLVHRGMDAFNFDEAATRTVERYDRSVRRAGWGADSPALRRLLTPSHVLRGLATHVQHGLTDSAVFLCLARLGEPSPQLMVPKDCSHDALTRSRHNHTTQNPPWDGKPNSPDVVVKTEEQ